MSKMTAAIGTKLVMAMPMTRQEYNDYRGWALPADENGADEGYLVEYTDGGPQNHPNHQGYTSWSPKAVFERAYNRIYEGMTFGHAVELLKQGNRVTRKGWNGKSMFLYFVPGSTFKVNRPPLDGIYPTGAEIIYRGHIDMRTAQGDHVPWVASQTDILADDWVVF